MARRKAARTIRCAVIGYGGAFNMGKGHAQWINAERLIAMVAEGELQGTWVMCEDAYTYRCRSDGLYLF